MEDTVHYGLTSESLAGVRTFIHDGGVQLKVAVRGGATARNAVFGLLSDFSSHGLVRAAAELVIASVMPELQVRMSRGLKVVADCLVVVRGAGCTLCCFLIRVQETGRLDGAVTRVKQTRESKCTISVFLLTTSNSLSSILP